MKCNIPKPKTTSDADRKALRRTMLEYTAEKIKEQNEKEEMEKNNNEIQKETCCG
jgi:hypothetical protein